MPPPFRQRSSRLVIGALVDAADGTAGNDSADGGPDFDTCTVDASDVIRNCEG